MTEAHAADGPGQPPPALLAGRDLCFSHPGPPGRGDPGAPGDGAPVLDGVSVDVRAGELVALIGPNGAGKTTLLRVLAGLLPPGWGEVRLGGVPLARLSPRLRARQLALMPQAASLGLDFRCLDFVLMGRYPHLRPLQPEGPRDLALARAAIAEMELGAAEQRSTAALSAGERQRLLFSRARCQEAAVLLCDEPAANLDLRHRALLFGVLQAFAAEGGGVLAALHDLDLAARYCDRLVLLCAGRVLADGPPAAVLTAERIREAYAVQAAVRPDPVTGTLHVAVLGPA